RPPAFYGGLFLTALATLVLEVVDTRILSVLTWYHLAFLAISLALLGMTAGALWVYLRPGPGSGYRLRWVRCGRPPSIPPTPPPPPHPPAPRARARAGGPRGPLPRRPPPFPPPPPPRARPAASPPGSASRPRRAIWRSSRCAPPPRSPPIRRTSGASSSRARS